jgi:hypothetical protein
MEFQTLQAKQINRSFSKKNTRGPDLLGLGRSSENPAQIQREGRRGGGVLNLPVGSRGQRPRAAESVPGKLGRPIKLRSMADARRLRGNGAGRRKP